MVRSSLALKIAQDWSWMLSVLKILYRTTWKKLISLSVTQVRSWPEIHFVDLVKTTPRSVRRVFVHVERFWQCVLFSRGWKLSWSSRSSESATGRGQRQVDGQSPARACPAVALWFTPAILHLQVSCGLNGLACAYCPMPLMLTIPVTYFLHHRPLPVGYCPESLTCHMTCHVYS